MSEPESFDGAVLKALGHPLRLRLLEAVSEHGEASPVALAREFDQSLATVSHHVRMLRDLGFLELTRTRPRRGAMEHFYRAVTLPFIDDDDWERLPLAMRRGLSMQTFRRIFTEASAAGAEGGFDDPGSHIARMALHLDKTGRQELSDATDAFLKRADEIQRRADTRGSRGEGNGAMRPSRLAILHHRVAESASPTAPEPDGHQPPRHARPRFP